MSDKNKLLEYNQTTEKNNFYRTDSKIIQTGENTSQGKVIQFSKTFCVNIKSEKQLKEISCILCNNISTCPKMCENCNSLYCYYCTKKYEADLATFKKCSNCKNISKLVNLTTNIKNKLDNLEIKCLNNITDEVKTCKEILILKDLINHFNVCKYSKGYAKCMGCNKEGLYDEIISHTINCEEIILKCINCSRQIKKKFYLEHEKICLTKTKDDHPIPMNLINENFESVSKDIINMKKQIEEITKQFSEEKISIPIFPISSKNINLDNETNIFSLMKKMDEVHNHFSDENYKNDNQIIFDNQDFYELQKKTDEILETCNIKKINNLQNIRSITKCHENANIYSIIKIKARINNQNLIVTAGGDNYIKLWTLPDFINTATLVGHQDQVLTLCEIKNKKKLLSTGEDQIVILWDLEKCIMLKKFEYSIHDNRIWKILNFKVDLSNFGYDHEEAKKYMISCGDDRKIKIFNYETEDILMSLDNTYKTTSILQYNLAKEKFQNCKTFENKTHLLVSGDSSRRIKVWNLLVKTKEEENRVEFTGNLLKTLDFHEKFISDLRKIKWKKDLFTIVSASGDKTIRIINIETGDCLNTLTGHSDSIYCLEQINFNSNEKKQISQVYPISLLTKSTLIPNINDNEENNTIIATGSKDNTMRFWDLEKGVILKTITDKNDKVRCILNLNEKTKLNSRNNFGEISYNTQEIMFICGGSESKIKIWK